MELERLKIGDREILLLGTAHISGKSIEDVRKAIEEEKPDTIGVELDSQRYAQLKQGAKWEETDISKVISSGQTYLFLLSLLLANIQRSLGEKVGIKPGMEMMEAISRAEEKKIPVVLLDRNVNVTLKRAMSRMSLWEKISLLGSITTGLFGNAKNAVSSEGIEQLKDKDVLNKLMQELAKEMPSVKEVLVDERDAYIANNITRTPGKKVLAIVGAGHLEGIKKLIGKQIDVSAISRVEKGRDYLKIIGYAIPIIFFIAIAFLFLTKGTGVTITAVAYWIIATGALAALGALLAGAHPFSIIAAFIGAPIATLHPLLASGWIAGYVEAKFKSPKIKDFHELRNLNSFEDFTKNQVTKILLVVAFTNIGATIGVIVAFPLIASLLG